MEGVINARTTLLSGVTTVRDVGAAGTDAWSVFVLRDAIRDGKIPGPRILAAGSIISATGGHGDRRLTPDRLNAGTESTGACDDQASCRRAVRRQFRQGSDLIKITATGGGGARNGGKDDPPAFFPDELAALVDTAHSLNLKITAHAHGTAGINAALKAGVDSIEHGSFLDDDSIATFKKNGAYLVPTLSVQDRIKRELEAGGDPVYMVERKKLFQAEHAANVGRARKAGVKIAMGTDAGVVPHGQNAHELEWYVSAGLSEMEAIVTATINGAALLGLSEEVGTLEPGKSADIIAVSADPTENISALKDIALVMKQGKTYNADSL